MKDVVRKFAPPGSAEMPSVSTEAFKDDASRRVILRCSSNRVDRSGEVVVQTGIDLTSFRRNPVILWQHGLSSPVARAVGIGIASSGCLECEVQFPDAGLSKLADQIYALVRANIVKGVSIGLLPGQTEPLDKGNPAKGPQRYLSCELLEVSLVSVPSNIDGEVIWKYADGDRATWLENGRKHVQQQDRRKRELEVLRLKAAP